jgi:site-specific DNA recombinase
MSERLGQVLADIRIPDDVLVELKQSLLTDGRKAEDQKKSERQRLNQRLSQIRQRLDQAYLDKLDGKIDEGFWDRKSVEWRGEEQQVLSALEGLEQASEDRRLDAARILELANVAYSLYVSRKPAEQGQLLKMVLSNCAVDGASLYPTYRKPFDLIFQRAKMKKWRREWDSNPRYGFPYTRFPSVRLQPLGHLSSRGNKK